MACNVFGTPVTVETLKGMPEYAERESISRRDLAEVALLLKNAEGKDVNARSYVENLYKRFEGNECVLGLIYNATGSLLRYTHSRDFNGYVGCGPYPVFIENAQWGAFVYYKRNGSDSGANGAVVYRGYDLDGAEFDYFIAWDNGVGDRLSKAYIEQGIHMEYDTIPSNELRAKLENANNYGWLGNRGFLSTAMIGNEKMAILEVIIRLEL